MKIISYKCDYCEKLLADTAIGVRFSNGIIQCQRVQLKKYDLHDRLFCSWEHQGKYMEDNDGSGKEVKDHVGSDQ